MATAVPVILSGPSGARIWGGAFPTSVSEMAGAAALASVATSGTLGGSNLPPATGDARDARAYLFQATPSSSLPSRLTANPLHNLAYDVWGPTNKWVDMHTQWLWTNLGGDWIDSTLTPQGSTVWGTVDSPLGTPGTVYDRTISITTALQNVQANNRWCAFNIVGGASYRARPDQAPAHRGHVYRHNNSYAAMLGLCHYIWRIRIAGHHGRGHARSAFRQH